MAVDINKLRHPVTDYSSPQYLTANKIISERWNELGFNKVSDCDNTYMNISLYANANVTPATTLNNEERAIMVSDYDNGELLEIQTPETNKKPYVKKDKKFTIGGIYYIYPFSNRRLKKTYVLKKYIYTINEEEVRAVIMKQIAGSTTGKKYTLNRTDCLMLHLKYEPGLEVFSMDLDWKLKNNKQKNGNK